MPRLNQNQFDAIAELIHLRPSSNGRGMAELVLVDGLEIGDAAREYGVPYAKAWDAVKRVERGLELAHKATG